MGICWSDVLYPNNPKRRDEVNKLVQSIRASFFQIYGNVRSVSLTLNQAYHKFQVLDPLDLNLTFQKSIDKINATLEQWKDTTEKLKMDPSIPAYVKRLMTKFDQATSVGQFPDTVKDILSHPSIAGNFGSSVPALIAGTVATYFIKLELGAVMSSVTRATISAGILGGLVGMTTGVLANMIIGAIEGAKERGNLEELKSRYSAMDENLRKHLNTLEQDVASVQRAIIKALP